MSLTIIETKILDGLPVTQSQFIKARFCMPIKSYRDHELESKIIDVVQITLAESGVKDQNDKPVIKFISETLFRDLRAAKFNYLTMEDIALAMNMGVRYEYGQYMGINVATIHSWIKAYLADKNRELALKEFHKKVDEASYGTTDKTAKANPEGVKKLVESLKEIMKSVPAVQEEKKRQANLGKVKTPRDQYIQKCFAEFDKIHLDRALRTKSGRYILFEGKAVDQVGYAEMKLKEYDKSNT